MFSSSETNGPQEHADQMLLLLLLLMLLRCRFD
jgi:hypothetical protein